jgi:hypothetical protein
MLAKISQGQDRDPAKKLSGSAPLFKRCESSIYLHKEKLLFVIK